MEARLLQLSMDFQDATHIRIAATTHRAIRENIAVNNELEKMLETQRNLRKENEMMKERDRQLNLEVRLREEERDIVLAKNMVQNKLINRLSTEYDEMARNIGSMQNSAQRAVEVEQQVQETRQFLDRAVRQIAVLEEKLQATEYEKNESISKLLQSNIETYKLQKILHAAVKSVKEALEIQTHPSSDEAFNLSLRENLLNNLLQMLNTADFLEFEKNEEKLVSLMKTSAMYVIGDLGLVPRSLSDVGSHYTVGSDILMESVNANVEDCHHSSKMEMGSNKFDTSEEKFLRLAKDEKSEIGFKKEEDSKVSFKSVTEKGSQEEFGGKITEPLNGEIKQGGGETAEPQYQGEFF
ncbi:hypothetical protein B7P43_G07682 [Cryptotermes secundus]|nr:hypothetical protein B7P43_G07682 [Cryptotermes secundus]